MLDRIEREHHTVPVDPACTMPRPVQGPADVVAMYARFASATLFQGSRAWKILPAPMHEVVTIEGTIGPRAMFVRRIELPEGRSLCCEIMRSTGAGRAYDAPKHWIVGIMGRVREKQHGLFRYAIRERAGFTR